MDKNSDIEITEAHNVEVTSVFTLFKQGLVFAKTNYVLVLILTLIPSVFIVSEFLRGYIQGTVWWIILYSALAIVTTVFYMLSFVATAHFVAKPNGEEFSVSESFGWAWHNFLPLVWIYILVSLAVWGGFLLLIIPGIIISGLLYFSPFAYIHEKKRGLEALLRSREIVLGRWWYVVGRLALVSVFSFLGMLAISIPVSILALLVPVLQMEIFAEIFFQFISSTFLVISFYCLNQMFLEYRALPVSPKSAKGRVKYLVLMWLGIALVIIIGVLITIAILFTEAIQQLGSQEEPTVIRSELMTAAVVAEERYKEKGSYEGVCESVLPMITGSEQIECNNGENSWAMTAVTENEMWCIDSTGYNKLLQVPLGEREGCLPPI